MSEQNQATLEVYQKTAQRYMENTITHDNLDPAKAEQKRRRLENFLAESFATLPDNADVFEIGAADGQNSRYLSSLGFNVMATDVADAFLQEMAAHKMKIMKFNALTDDFPQQYSGVLAWRIFVHFTPDDARVVMQKVHAALKDGGRFIFNAINREFKDVDEEWADFPGEYKMNAERFFHYYRKDELEKIATDAGFKIVNFHFEGGETGKKWLVFVVEK